jgi:catechol 2,3-dioxygenase-like lactoylglutathione lyase family enzyme
MEQRLSFVTLGVADLERSSAFYQRLGWTPARAGQGLGIVFFQLGGIVLGLFPRHELAKDAGVADTPAGGFSGMTLAHNTRSREEADAVMAQALAAGAVLTKPLQTVFWGGYTGYFADPDGHLWEVCHNPQAQLAEDGSLRIDRA